MTDKKFTLAAIGCSGHVAEIFVDGFLKQGINVRLLARNPEALSVRYPEVELIKGSMMNATDVAKVMEGADAAFLVTPMGICNNTSTESEAVAAAIEGAKAVRLKHLIFVAAIGIDNQTGVPLLDAKHKAERLLASSNVPWTSLRCGSYMEDVFNARLSGIKRGSFLFPVTKTRRFTYTSQVDVPRFVVQELLQTERVLNRPFNLVAPGTFTPLDLEKLMTQASGRKVKASGKFPFYYLLILLKPYFNWTRKRFATILPLIRYFDSYGYTASGDTVADLFPNFKMTTVEEHIRRLLS